MAASSHVYMFTCILSKCKYRRIEPGESIGWVQSLVKGECIFYCDDHLLYHICPEGKRDSLCVMDGSDRCLYTGDQKSKHDEGVNIRIKGGGPEEEICCNVSKFMICEEKESEFLKYIKEKYSPYTFRMSIISFLEEHKACVKGGLVYTPVVESCIHRLYVWFHLNARADIVKKRVSEKKLNFLDRRFSVTCMILLAHIAERQEDQQKFIKEVGTNKEQDAYYRRNAAKLISYDLTDGKLVPPLWVENKYVNLRYKKLALSYSHRDEDI